MNDVNDPLFLIIGYGLTWAALAWYAVRLARRLRGASDLVQLAQPEPERDAPSESPG